MKKKNAHARVLKNGSRVKPLWVWAKPMIFIFWPLSFDPYLLIIQVKRSDMYRQTKNSLCKEWTYQFIF